MLVQRQLFSLCAHAVWNTCYLSAAIRFSLERSNFCSICLDDDINVFRMLNLSLSIEYDYP